MASKGEADLGALLRQEYPHYTIIPQYAIKIKRHTLFIDYYIPQLGLAVECDGRQHAEFVKHFHGNRLGFGDSQYRDRLKEEWCAAHSVRLIRISYRDRISLNTLREKIHGQEEERRDQSD